MTSDKPLISLSAVQPPPGLAATFLGQAKNQEIPANSGDLSGDLSPVQHVSTRNETRTVRSNRGKIRGICSPPVLLELVSYRGEIFGPYPSLELAGLAAESKWPDQEQDPDRSGLGWDVQLAGVR